MGTGSLGAQSSKSKTKKGGNPGNPMPCYGLFSCLHTVLITMATVGVPFLVHPHHFWGWVELSKGVVDPQESGP